MNSFRFLFLILTFNYSYLSLSANAQDNPVATPESVITEGNARFTLLTPELIRLEYSDTKTFEDKASLAFIHRHTPTPRFSQKREGNSLTITTEKLTLHYINNGKPFDQNNLTIDVLDMNPSTQPSAIGHWAAGAIDDKNLKGTLRTLDMADGWNFENKLENGLVSRNGWALVDDSNNNLFDGNPDWNWVTPRTNKETDWYFFGYGKNYKKALQDFTQIAGKIPMPPKYAFGYWWSRYWIYNDNEMRSLVQNLRDFNIPIDVLIVDMDWHETYDFSSKKLIKDSQDQWKGWTGYTWNKSLFPEPQAFIEWTDQQQLKTALNLHPASGVPTMEEKHAEFAKKMGTPNTKEYIPFDIANKKWAEIYFDTLLKPMQDWGVDFWWLDWQQYLNDKNNPSLSVTWWLNYTFFTNREKSGVRPMIFHRWGGLGNHRYPIGFSGDANTNWSTLDFETYFTATAANQGYAYWSHDIGGHIGNDKPTDGELYLRWIQFGVLSPILRTHSSKIALIERRPWMFPQQFFAMRDAIQFRYRLAPYIYAAAHETYDTGIAMVHPLYYQYPNATQAYDYKTEYFFGKDMIAAPITSPIDTQTQLASKKIWLPEGEWFDLSRGNLLQGNAEITRQYALDEIPLFARAGSIIPMNPKQIDNQPIKNLQQKINNTLLTIIPGGQSGDTVWYADDENTTGYKQGEFVTRAIHAQYDKQSILVTINATKGDFKNADNTHRFDLQLVNRSLPSKVLVNGKAAIVPMAFDPEELTTTIQLPEIAKQESMTIECVFDKSLREQDGLFNGNKGFLRRMNQATEKLKYASALNDWGGTLPNAVYSAGNIVNQLRYHPEQSLMLMKTLNQYKPTLAKTILSIDSIPPETSKPIIDFLDL